MCSINFYDHSYFVKKLQYNVKWFNLYFDPLWFLTPIKDVQESWLDTCPGELCWWSNWRHWFILIGNTSVSRSLRNPKTLCVWSATKAQLISPHSKSCLSTNSWFTALDLEQLPCSSTMVRFRGCCLSSLMRLCTVQRGRKQFIILGRPDWKKIIDLPVGPLKWLFVGKHYSL